MFTIIAVEQGWLDSFNNQFGTDYKSGQTFEASDNEVINNANWFNHVVAGGEAIVIEKVDKE